MISATRNAPGYLAWFPAAALEGGGFLADPLLNLPSWDILGSLKAAGTSGPCRAPGSGRESSTQSAQEAATTQFHRGAQDPGEQQGRDVTDG